MPLAPMEKVLIAVHLSEKNKALAYLQKASCFQFSEKKEKDFSDASFENHADLQDVEKAIQVLARISGEKKNFIENFAPYKESIKLSELVELFSKYKFDDIVEKVLSTDEKAKDFDKKISDLKKEIQKLLPWLPLDKRLSDLYQSRRTKLLAGSVPLKKENLILEEIKKVSSFVAVQKINEFSGRSYLLIFLLNEVDLQEEFLSKYSFSKVILPKIDKTPKQEIEILRSQIEQIKEQKELLDDQLLLLSKELPNLRKVYDFLLQQSLLKAAEQKGNHTNKTIYWSGWMPKEKIFLIEKGLQETAPASAVFVVKPEDGENPPTLLKNPKVFYPFELITGIFGYPGKDEIDPTILLSFFYILFFAMCLSDVGYGVVLTIASLFFLKTLTLSEGGKKLLTLLFMGGIATVIFGAITGAYFGADPSIFPLPLQLTLSKLRLIDPIKNPLSVLMISIALGFIQNIFGVFVSMVVKILRGRWLEGILDDGLWIFFLISLALFAVATFFFPAKSFIFSRLAIIGAVLLVLTQGRSESSIIKKLINGLLSLYRTTSYLGDTLSYSRLLALMMTTSIIGMVINLIAQLTQGIPIVGYLLMVVILFFGHIFNLLISVLGAFIHSARLQLVEFFGKFYSGSGKEFRPFSYNTKYVSIK